MHTHIVINNIKNMPSKKYLELGISDNYTFKSVTAVLKYSVDINGKATFTGTTDEFFKGLNSEVRFDVIYIDANHDYDYVIRDFNNSVDVCNEWILIHDMIPPNFEETAQNKCSDSYKLLYYFIENNFDVYPMDANFGLTLVRMPSRKANPSEKYHNITYKEFVEFMKDKRLYTGEELCNIVS